MPVALDVGQPKTVSLGRDIWNLSLYQPSSSHHVRGGDRPMCRASSSVVAVIVSLAALSAAAAGEVKITVDKNIQRMTVTVDGIERYSWPVSTGLEDYATPT